MPGESSGSENFHHLANHDTESRGGIGCAFDAGCTDKTRKTLEGALDSDVAFWIHNVLVEDDQASRDQVAHSLIVCKAGEVIKRLRALLKPGQAHPQPLSARCAIP